MSDDAVDGRMVRERLRDEILSLSEAVKRDAPHSYKSQWIVDASEAKTTLDALAKIADEVRAAKIAAGRKTSLRGFAENTFVWIGTGVVALVLIWVFFVGTAAR